MIFWDWFVGEPRETQLLLVDGARAFVLLVGLVIAAIALILTAKRNNISNKQQVNQYFISAVENLGHDQVSVRLGGIYALEQIAQDNPRTHYLQVMETLCAHIRQYSKIAKYYETRRDAPNTKHEKEIENLQEKALKYMISPELDVVPEDIFAAFVVLGRRRYSRKFYFLLPGRKIGFSYSPRGLERGHRFSLNDAHLSFLPQSSDRLNFSFFDFGDANFSYGSIMNYKFNFAEFRDTDFEVCMIDGSDFRASVGGPATSL